MLVAQIVNRNAPTVGPEDDIVAAVHRLAECRCGVLPVVVDEKGGARIVGILRYRDALGAVYGTASRAAMPVAAAMSPAGPCCHSSDSLGVAVRLLRRSGTEAVPVLDAEGYLVGVLSFADLVERAAP